MTGVRQFDEDKVLAEALDVFWRKGLRATSMLDLAEATGVQRGSLYNAFGDKEDLFLLAFDRYACRFLEIARKSLEGPDIGVALTKFFKTMIANMSNGLPPRGCLTTKTATESGLVGETVSRKVRDLLDGLESLIETALSRHPDQLVLPPKEAAKLLVTFTRGLAVMERVYHDRKQLQGTADALLSTLVVSRRAAKRRRQQGLASSH